jgi:hypothetical protein
MEDNKPMSSGNVSSSNASLDPGKKAILAEDKAKKMDTDDPEAKKQKAKDAEKRADIARLFGGLFQIRR